jgi:hypothetical protein
MASGINSQCQDAETVYSGAFKPLNAVTVQPWRAVLKRERNRACVGKGSEVLMFLYENTVGYMRITVCK